MEYLWWYVPAATSPMIIALIATVHIFVSHYAVGGGIFLAAETARAHRTGDERYLKYLHRHAQFFILLTVVFGAITGVGIWWAIGLASPLATETLIRTFVFGWAAEWVLFVVELVAAFLFFYLWNRLTPRVHTAIGWIYAAAAWGSLVLITGITAFMLDPGKWLAATNAGTEGSAFWLGFFNPQFLPQCTARTGAALLLASAYILFHASIFISDEEVFSDGTTGKALKAQVVRRAARYIAAGILLALLGVSWAGIVLPKTAWLALGRAAALNIILGAGAAAAGMLLLLLTLLVRKPQWLSPAAGTAVLLASFGVLTAGEFVREAIRKPYIVTECIYGNQIHVQKVNSLRENGLLESGRWTKPYLAEKFPYLVDENSGKLVLERIHEADKNAVGEVLFMHHCNDCHARTLGYNGLSLLSTTSRRGELAELVKNLDSMVYYMPPWCGTDAEAELLAGYLESIAEKHPAGKMYDIPKKSAGINDAEVQKDALPQNDAENQKDVPLQNDADIPTHDTKGVSHDAA